MLNRRWHEFRQPGCTSGNLFQSKNHNRVCLTWSGLEWENDLTPAAGLNRSVSPLCGSCRHLPVCDIPVDEVGLESGVGGVKITVFIDGCGGHAGDGIGDIVVGTGRVIDAVAATASGAAL